MFRSAHFACALGLGLTLALSTSAQQGPLRPAPSPTASATLASLEAALLDHPGADDTIAFAGTTVQQAYLKASNSGVFDFFGGAVAISGDTIVIGTNEDDSGASGVNGDDSDTSKVRSGAAFVFVRSGGTWTLEAYLKASHPGFDHFFGSSVAIDGDTIAVGAPDENSGSTGIDGDADNNGAGDSGAVFVFARSGTTWSQQAYVKASNTNTADGFGRSVALSGDTLLVGANGERSNATGVNGNQNDNSLSFAGAAYVFVRSGSTWSQQAYLKASNTGSGDQFGGAVSLSGDTAVVGASVEQSNATGVNGDEANNAANVAGAAYVFVRSGSSWSQQAYLKASNTEANDQFGSAVAVDGDTILISAPEEDSDAAGVNGAQGNNASLESGAAYVFTRTGSTWSQQAYLKASTNDIGWGDRFGVSVGLSGDVALVGSVIEASDADGIDGDESDNTAAGAGAGYVFTRDAGSWSQTHYLKASNSDSSDSFGSGVALADGTIVVGARIERSNATTVNGDQTDNSLFGAGAAYVFQLAGFAVDPWSDEGCALAGVSGDPLLVGSGTLSGGDPAAVDLSNAAPSAFMGLFISLSSTPTPFKTGTLKPVPWLKVLFTNTTGGGALSLPFVMPAGVPTGTELWVQAAIQDAAGPVGVALSNAIKGTTP